MSLSLIAAQPRILDPSMPKPSSNESCGQLADGIGDVLLQTRQIREAQIHLANFFAFRKLQNLLRIHLTSIGWNLAPAYHCFNHFPG